MLLTIQDTGVPRINIHGPKGMVDVFNRIKKIVLLQTLKIHEAECNESQSYVDSVMSVSYVSITKSSEQEAESIVGEKVDVNYDYSKTNSKVAEPKRQKIEQRPEKRISTVMSYICKLHPRAGMLCLEKCLEKGVKPGPLLGQLKAGDDITLPDGTVVLSKDVCLPATPGPAFISMSTENLI